MKKTSEKSKKSSSSPDSVVISSVVPSHCPEDIPYYDKKGSVYENPAVSGFLVGKYSPIPPKITFAQEEIDIFYGTTSIVASALGFDICELWIKIHDDDWTSDFQFPFFCVHSFIGSDLTMRYSSLVASVAFPKKEHIVTTSSSLCHEITQQKEYKDIIWSHGAADYASAQNLPEYSELCKCDAFGTTMAKSSYYDKNRNLEYFVVAYSLKKILMHENIPKFLKCLGDGLQLCSRFTPRCDDSHNIAFHSGKSSQYSHDDESSNDYNSNPSLKIDRLEIDVIEGDATYFRASPSPDKMNPPWEHPPDYSFPIENIPVVKNVPCNLNFFVDIENVKHLTHGLSANIYLATFKSQRVIVKMLREDLQANDVACEEFRVEYEVLLRLNHPHIINILGGGRLPRPFMILEYLEGETLQHLLQQNDRVDMGLAQKLLHKHTFTYLELLKMAKALASALSYLHSGVHPAATIIHRDLKPDNIGFLQDGVVKVFDLGLCTCVKRSSCAADVYKMTGNTGSLRYMAPEVALKQSYNELVDVYSFGVVVWQMARDKVPFRSYDKTTFMREVIVNKRRPKLDEKWPKAFQTLLSSCWDNDFINRSSFAEIEMQVDKMIEREEARVKLSWTRLIKKPSGFSNHNRNKNVSSSSHMSTLSKMESSDDCQAFMSSKPSLVVKTSFVKESGDRSDHEKPASPIKRVLPEARDSSWF